MFQGHFIKFPAALDKMPRGVDMGAVVESSRVKPDVGGVAILMVPTGPRELRRGIAGEDRRCR